MTGSALVITRLSRVAMNIGSEVASTASHTGTMRTRRLAPAGRAGRACRDPSGGAGTVVGSDIGSQKASNDYLLGHSK